ncbi:tigger transposable element-derived protein [Plakobranchus ocellatus]|uniref:Tigger transposable element-derived protein n=1 Tax=Plakobranchus ocellatus TaxID=259542 RepID=A0AAV4DTY1_9GAST|nr:tigger transposable element-derived protein [Plakobranchus ocellatus]
MDISKKLPLLVIGKAVKPRSFSNVKSLPLDYRANKKAWMTSSIFVDWLRKLDSKFFIQGRSVLMIVNNCPWHPAVNGLAAIRLDFLPSNTTSHTQPCDQGIIHSFKRHYREKIVKMFLSDNSNGESTTSNSSAFHVFVLNALYNMQWAWARVSRETVTNCFQHAGFNTPVSNPTQTQTV